eukprot:PLAT8478.1.p2 GENE.PLAT8478.1~~PLAT8478.1.p2  ORF type:complete len:190 (-),score=71.67 PLAT8478.1:163-732(-)
MFSISRSAQRSNEADGAALCTVFVSVSVEEAVRRDGGREGAEHVGEGVIRRMADKLEAPEEGWEAAICVDGEEEDVDVTALWTALQAAALRPERAAFAVDEEARRAEREEARLETARSGKHRADIALRDAVSAAVRAMSPERRRTMAPRLAGLRRQLLADVKAAGWSAEAIEAALSKIAASSADGWCIT